MKNYRRVAIVEKFRNILKQVHDKDCIHATYPRVSLKLHSSIAEV